MKQTNKQRKEERKKEDILENHFLQVMVSKQVATYLGLYVAESTLQNNPQFSQLLENLLNHTSALSPLGCDQNLYDRFKQVKREFEQEKKLYFEQLFLYEELQEICLDGKLLNSKQRNPDLVKQVILFISHF